MNHNFFKHFFTIYKKVNFSSVYSITISVTFNSQHHKRSCPSMCFYIQPTICMCNIALNIYIFLILFSFCFFYKQLQVLYTFAVQTRDNKTWIWENQKSLLFFFSFHFVYKIWKGILNFPQFSKIYLVAFQI